MNKELHRLYQLRDEAGYIAKWFELYNGGDLKLKLYMLRQLDVKHRLYSTKIALRLP